MSDLKNRRDEILKGCGKKFRPFQSKISIVNYEVGICGKWENSTLFLCNNCQARLDELDRTIIDIHKIIEED